MEARQAAIDFWSDPSLEHRLAYRSICGPLYTQTPGNLFEAVEMVRNDELFTHWNDGEHTTFDLRPDLAKAQCPVLVLGGVHDPVCPIAGAEEIASCLPTELVRFEQFAHSGHSVFRGENERAYSILASSWPADRARSWTSGSAQEDWLVRGVDRFAS